MGVEGCFVCVGGHWLDKNDAKHLTWPESEGRMVSE